MMCACGRPCSLPYHGLLTFLGRALRLVNWRCLFFKANLALNLNPPGGQAQGIICGVVGGPSCARAASAPTIANLGAPAFLLSF